MALPLRQVTSTPTSSTIDGTNAAGGNPLSATVPAPVSVASPFGASFNQAAQMVAGGKLTGATYTATVSGTDSGPNGQTLTIPSSGVALVASPSGVGFGGAVELTNNGAYLTGPDGDTNAQGAVVGTAFTAECRFTPPIVNTTDGSDQWVLSRWLVTNEWVVYIPHATNVFAVSWNGTPLNGTTALAAGTTYEVALVWDGATLYLFVDGNLDASVAVSTAAAPTSAQGLMMGGYSGAHAGAIIDEVRISNIARYTASYTPDSAPFASDANTGCLYHLDGVLPGADFGAVIGDGFTAELSYQPSVEDLRSSAGISLARVADAGHPDQWGISLDSNGLYAYMTEASGTQYQTSPHIAVTAGVNYAVAISWDGSNFYFFVNGTLEQTIGLSGIQFAYNAQLIIADPYGSPASGIIDELRISTTCRYTASYTPASSPFGVDNNTACLYHLDSASQGLTKLKIGPVPLNHVWTGSIVLENTAATTQWLVKIGGITWGVLTGSGPYGPLDALSGEVLELTTTNPAPANPVGSDVTLVFIGQDQHQTEVRSYTSPISPSGIITNSA